MRINTWESAASCRADRFTAYKCSFLLDNYRHDYRILSTLQDIQNVIKYLKRK